MPGVVDGRAAAVPGHLLPAGIDGHKGLLLPGERVVDFERRERNTSQRSQRASPGRLLAAGRGGHPGGGRGRGRGGGGGVDSVGDRLAAAEGPEGVGEEGSQTRESGDGGEGEGEGEFVAGHSRERGRRGRGGVRIRGLATTRCSETQPPVHQARDITNRTAAE